MNNNFLLEVKRRVEIGENEWSKKFPDVLVPHRVEHGDGRFYLSGYFVSFDDDHIEKNLFAKICQGGFGSLVNSNSQFVLFFLDRKTKTLTVGVDQFLSLPCYFAEVGDSLIFSSSIGRIKKEIRPHKKLKVNLDKVLSYILREFSNTDSTLVEQIKIIPGGCEAIFDLNQLGDYKIRSLVDIDGYYASVPVVKYDSLETFASDWVALLTELVLRRYRTIPTGTNIGCDVSSGFDCALIAYCMSQVLPHGSFTGYSNYSQIMGDENNLDIVRRFAKLHQFSLKTFDYTSDSKHEMDLDLAWADDPLHPFYFVHHLPYVKFLANQGVGVLFSGDYGDEAYDMKQMELFSRFPIQQAYFRSVRAFRKKIDPDIFPKEASELFLDWNRYNQRGYYPLIVPENSVSYQPLIEGYNDHGIVLLHVFNDTRLLALSTQAPLPSGTGSDQLKELLVPYFRSIMPENYYATSNACEPFVYFFMNQKSFVDTVLDNSALAEMGLIKVEHILKLVHDPQSEIYTSKDSQRAVQIYELLKLDWYLQKNNIG